VLWFVTFAAVLLAGESDQGASRSLRLSIRPVGPWCQQHGKINAELGNTGKVQLILGISRPSDDHTDWPGSYSYVVLDRWGTKIDEYGIISTFDCVRQPGQTGPIKCDYFRLTLPAGGSVSWTLPLPRVPTDLVFAIDLTTSLSVLSKGRFGSVDVHARRKFRIVGREAECLYAAGV